MGFEYMLYSAALGIKGSDIVVKALGIKGSDIVVKREDKKLVGVPHNTLG